MASAQSIAYDPKTNITSASIPSSTGAPPDLEATYRALEQKAENAMSWYESRQQGKKRGARRTRGTAIGLGTITTIIPSVIALLPERLSWWVFDDFSSLKLNPIATIAGVAAATMILLDRFYGFSSGWMRYVTTYQEIQTNLEAFRINWRKQILKLNSNRPPTDEQVLGVYDFLSSFLTSLNDSVRNETQAWVTEFKGTLQEMDKTVEAQKAAALAQTKASLSGGIHVTLQDYETLDDRSWTLQLDNREPETRVGQASAAIPLLEPGQYRLRIAGLRAQTAVGAEFLVTVKTGEVFEQRVTKLG